MSRRNEGRAAPRNAATKKRTQRKREIKEKAPKFQRDSKLKSDDYLYGDPYPAAYRNDSFDALCGVEWKVLDHCDGEQFLEPIKVSNEGALRYVDRNTGILMEFRGGKDDNGYLRKIIRTDKHPNGRKFRVHRLVSTAFNGDIPVGLEIDHIRGDKTDNRVFNLRVLNHGDNLKAFGNDRRTHNKSLPVKAVNLKTGKVIYFASVNDAGRNGFNSGHVAAACKGINNKKYRKDGGTDIYNGYRWSYVNMRKKSERIEYETYMSGQCTIF